MNKNTARNSSVSNNSEVNGNVGPVVNTMITSIMPFAEWARTVNVEVYDEITPTLTAGQLAADPSLPAKIGFLMDLRRRRGLVELRQAFLNSVKESLMKELHALKDAGYNANKIRITQIQGVFDLRPQVMYQKDEAGNFVVDESGDRIPMMNDDGTPWTKNMKYRNTPLPGQDIGKYVMKKDGLLTELFTEFNEVRYKELDTLHKAIEKVTAELEKEIGHNLRVTLAERDESLSVKFAELFPHLSLTA